MKSYLNAAVLITILLLTAFSQLAVAQTDSVKMNPALKDPSKLTEQAPDTFVVNLETSKGDIKIEVTRAWAPIGVDRFYNLVKNGYYDQCRFFRMVKNFVVQFGMAADPAISQTWYSSRIQDDPVKKSNGRGTVTFATSGANSRTTQLFINLRDNSSLDGMGFAPFGKLIDGGMNVVGKLHYGYAEKPNQSEIMSQGNAYLNAEFPQLDYIIKATIE